MADYRKVFTFPGIDLEADGLLELLVHPFASFLRVFKKIYRPLVLDSEFAGVKHAIFYFLLPQASTDLIKGSSFILRCS